MGRSGRLRKKYLTLNPAAPWVSLAAWVSGPYPEDLKAPEAPERDAGAGPDGPLKQAAGRYASPRWHQIPLTSTGLIHFSQLYDAAEHISAYALWRVYSPQRSQVSIHVGPDDQARVWLNGRIVHECLQNRPARPDSEIITTQFEPGWNTLLAKVANGTGGHALFLRFTGPSTARLSDQR